jgi:hypothetical protein
MMPSLTSSLLLAALRCMSAHTSTLASDMSWTWIQRWLLCSHLLLLLSALAFWTSSNLLLLLCCPGSSLCLRIFQKTPGVFMSLSLRSQAMTRCSTLVQGLLPIGESGFASVNIMHTSSALSMSKQPSNSVTPLHTSASWLIAASLLRLIARRFALLSLLWRLFSLHCSGLLYHPRMATLADLDWTICARGIKTHLNGWGSVHTLLFKNPFDARRENRTLPLKSLRTLLGLSRKRTPNTSMTTEKPSEPTLPRSSSNSRKPRTKDISQSWNSSSKQQSITRPITASPVTFRAAMQQVSEDTMARRDTSSSSNIPMVSFVLIAIISSFSTTLICKNTSRAKVRLNAAS